jgi:hypothetical protein
MRSVSAWIVSLSLLAACSSTDFPRGSVGITRDRKAIAGCRLLGEVTSRGGNKDLKRRALRLGGNAVYIFSESVSAGGGGVTEASAIVYLCPSR